MYSHVRTAVQAPFVHLSSCRSLQRVSSFAHEPLHCPRSQMAVHAGPSAVHIPSGPHTSGWAPLQRLVSGVHTPLHVFALHTKGQAEVLCHFPF
jgi:hypothetical protein